MCRVQRRISGDVCDLASSLCRYDFRKSNLFVLGWSRVRRVRRESISSELIICGGVRIILLLPLVARYDTIDVCISLWRMFVFMPVAVTM